MRGLRGARDVYFLFYFFTSTSSISEPKNVDLLKTYI